MKKPQEVLNYLKEKNPKLPFKYIASIFLEFNEKEHAVEAINKIKLPEDAVDLFIEADEWELAA